MNRMRNPSRKTKNRQKIGKGLLTLFALFAHFWGGLKVRFLL
jgi:hypothetical protein